jgi:hypothetical protein
MCVSAGGGSLRLTHGLSVGQNIILTSSFCATTAHRVVPSGAERVTGHRCRCRGVCTLRGGLVVAVWVGACHALPSAPTPPPLRSAIPSELSHLWSVQTYVAEVHFPHQSHFNFPVRLNPPGTVPVSPPMPTAGTGGLQRFSTGRSTTGALESAFPKYRSLYSLSSLSKSSSTRRLGPRIRRDGRVQGDTALGHPTVDLPCRIPSSEVIRRLETGNRLPTSERVTRHATLPHGRSPSREGHALEGGLRILARYPQRVPASASTPRLSSKGSLRSSRPTFPGESHGVRSVNRPMHIRENAGRDDRGTAGKWDYLLYLRRRYPDYCAV